MTSLRHHLDRALYPAFGDNWDNRMLREAVDGYLQTAAVALDLGAGQGRVREMDMRGPGRRIVGIDPEESVLSNPLLDEAHVGSGEKLPFEDGTVDLVVSNNVLEHLADPAATFAEVRRVLKPGGHFVAKTPNRRHYVALLARITPHGFHEWVNRKRGRGSRDTFVTLYRANTPSDIRRLARGAGLKIVSLRLIEGRPEYLRMTAPTYLLGWMYERAVNRVPFLAGLRAVMIVDMVKPNSSEA